MCSRRSSPRRDSSLSGLGKDEDVVVLATNGETFLKSVTVENSTSVFAAKYAGFGW
ncbi:MAG TPA: hypothetical protein VK475_06375 [Pyrinomonadaceae bacterium]|nr:hypothetical protein [Pyrinomonadaceae bacterium]